MLEKDKRHSKEYHKDIPKSHLTNSTSYENYDELLNAQMEETIASVVHKEIYPRGGDTTNKKSSYEENT